MQVDEILIRNVVEQVITRLGGNGQTAATVAPVDGGYQGGWSGTSMAGPHVAGAVALVLSAQPGLAGDVDAIEGVVEATAVPSTTTEGCGGDGSLDVPNNTYGWGRIDALAAVQLSPGFFSDGFESGDASRWAVVEP